MRRITAPDFNSVRELVDRIGARRPESVPAFEQSIAVKYVNDVPQALWA